MIPYLSAAVDPRTRDGDARIDAAVGVRLLRRLMASYDAWPVLRGAVEDLVAAPASEECAATLRWQVRRVLAADPAFAEELRLILTQAEVAADRPLGSD